MILRNFDELIGVAKFRGKRRVAVAKADDDLVLRGLAEAYAEDLIEPILFGDKARIQAEMAALGIHHPWRIEHQTNDDRKCAEAAVACVRSGEAELLMKGLVHTSILLSAVLDKQLGLRGGGVLSHLAFLEISHYRKLFIVTDGGLNVAPTFEQKVAIVENAVTAFHRLGYIRPKVALLSYVEKVRADDIETTDWARIVELAGQGRFGEALVDGPLAMDLCLSEDAKRIKESKSEVAADADVIVAPNITAGNASAKALSMQGGLIGGLVVGASAPIVMLSRTDSPRTRLCSLAAASALFAS